MRRNHVLPPEASMEENHEILYIQTGGAIHFHDHSRECNVYIIVYMPQIATTYFKDGVIEHFE